MTPDAATPAASETKHIYVFRHDFGTGAHLGASFKAQA